MNKTVAYVIQGRNAGAELEILPGKWTFGSSDSAWCCFEDTSVKDIHFEVELVAEDSEAYSDEVMLTAGESDSSSNNVEAEISSAQTVEAAEDKSAASSDEESDSKQPQVLQPGLYLRPVNGKVKVNGEEVNSLTRISESDLISFGLNELVFSPQGTELDKLLSRAEEIRNSGIEQKVSRAVDELREKLEQEYQEKLQVQTQSLIEAEAASKDAGDAQEDGDNKESLPADSPQEEHAPKETVRKVLDSTSLLLVLTALAGVIILAVLLFMLIFTDSTADTGESERIIRDYLADNNVSNIVISRDQGYLQVSGTVSSFQHRDRVLAALPEVGEVLVLKIQTYQTMLEDVKRAFAARGASVKVVRTTDQHLHIFGYVQDPVMEGSLMSSVKEILSGDSSLLGAVDGNSIAARSDKGAIITSDLVMEPHFIYEEDMKNLLQRLNTDNGLNLKYIYAPLDVAYISPVKLDSDRRFININRELAKNINAPIELMSIPELTYKYTLLKSSLASGKGTALVDGDYLASRAAQAALGTGHSSLLDSYQRGLDLLSPYNRRIMEQAGAVSAANAIPVPNKDVYKEATEEPLKQLNDIFGNIGQAENEDGSFTLPEGLILDNEPGQEDQMAVADSSTNSEAAVTSKPSTVAPDKAPPKAQSAVPAKKATRSAVRKNYDIVSITMKPLRFITMRDGSKIFEGGKMPGGAKLKKITVNYLILIDEKGKEVRYELK